MLHKFIWTGGSQNGKTRTYRTAPASKRILGARRRGICPDSKRTACAGSGEYLGILFKVVGITWLSEFCAGLCRDAGFSSIAAQVELFGKTAVLLAGMPVFLSLVETIAGFMS